MADSVKIDRALCSGYALCLEAAPEVFDLDQHDVAVVIATQDVLDAERANVEYAAKLCPRQAIRLAYDD